MFARLFSSSDRRQAPVASAPAGERIYAVGDVHGRLDLLDELLDRIEADDAKQSAAQSSLIFLGDLVDRGPESGTVIERLRALAADGAPVRFLMGNHEEVFLLALTGDIEAVKFFLRIGGDATVMSYGMSREEYARADFDEVQAFLRRAVPASHVAFLESFEDQIVLGDYAFVHAGVRPGVVLEQQKTADLRWIRGGFLDSTKPFGKIIVHGHTICDDVEERPNRIGIDTGAYCTGKLTAMAFEGNRRWTIQTGARDGEAINQKRGRA